MYMESNELTHHGVKGMKWGRRRYQNTDGSLTPAGKKRYQTGKTRFSYGPRLVRGHAGPGKYLGSAERKLAGAKHDLELLDQGKHLSVGLTPGRQKAYDLRDRVALNRKIARLEKKIQSKSVNDTTQLVKTGNEFVDKNGNIDLISVRNLQDAHNVTITAKAEYRKAYKEYSKSFDKAYNKSIAAYSPVKKHREANDARWLDAADKAMKADEARTAYKEAKRNEKELKKANKKRK